MNKSNPKSNPSAKFKEMQSNFERLKAIFLKNQAQYQATQLALKNKRK